MKPGKQVLLFLLLITLLSCRQEPEKILPGMWNVTTLKYPDFNRLMSAIPGGGSDASNTAMTSQIFRGNFFKLNDNKTFSCILGSGHFIYGSWKFNPADSIIRLEETGKSKHSILFWLKEWSSSQMILR